MIGTFDKTAHSAIKYLFYLHLGQVLLSGVIILTMVVLHH